MFVLGTLKLIKLVKIVGSSTQVEIGAVWLSVFSFQPNRCTCAFWVLMRVQRYTQHHDRISLRLTLRSGNSFSNRLTTMRTTMVTLLYTPIRSLPALNVKYSSVT